MLLRHELAHVRRCDLWWNWIAPATRFLFYFHPLVYVTLREWRLNQESACDELAVVGRPEISSHYAAMLLQIAVTQNPSRSLAYAVGVFESFETLKRRIEKMSQFGSRSSRHVQLAAMAFAVAAVAGLIPWKLVPSAAIGSAAVVAADIDHSNAVTKVGDMTIAVADVRDVSGLKHETRSDFSRLMKQMKLKAETRGFQTSKSASSPNAIASASGSGFGGGGGGGAFGTTKFAGHPNLAVALKVRPTKNTQVTIVDHLIGIDNDGREYKSLPTSSTAFMVCPDYERTQPDSAIAYFTKDTMAVREFAVLKGRLQVETAESETVEFKALRRSATKRTRLGEFKITALEKSDDGIKVAIQTPTPASLRSKLELRPRDARGFQSRMEAQRDLPGMIRVSFIGSDGNSYHANTRGSHGSGQSTSSTTTTTTTNGFQTKTSGGFSSQKAGVAEYIYGLTTLPAGVEIVGVRATVLEVPTSVSEVEFQIENVQIRE